MTLHPALRGTIGGLAAVLLVWLGWQGLSGGITEWSGTATPGQRAQVVTQFAYGAFAILALVTAFRWRQFRKFADLSFVISASVAAGLASVVWGEESVLAGVAAAVATAAIAGVIVWMLRVGRRTGRGSGVAGRG
jgi:hypothetical protein